VARLNQRQPSVATRSAPSVNSWSEQRTIAPITLPRLSFAADPPPDDSAVKTEEIIKIRIIRAGRDAWDEITKADSFDAWERIGAALAIGKQHACQSRECAVGLHLLQSL
jgi:hypothetical protein